MTPPMTALVEREAIDDLARVIVRSHGGEVTASDEWWPGAVSFHHAMCAKHPGYADGCSLVTDAYRTARAVQDHLALRQPGAEYRRGVDQLVLCADYLIGLHERMAQGKPVRDLAEAQGAYNAAIRALSDSDTKGGRDGR